MILTQKQEQGLKIAVERYKNHEPYTCIAGYAGSGKSTLIKYIVSALDLDESQICYIAYTGKAATVLTQKGCPNATTAHKLLYKAKPMPNGTFKFYPVDKFEEDYQLIVVDEVSMLPRDMWYLLLKHKIYVLACGDPEQLPPIDKDENNHVLDHPHIFLDEIMRQAQDSEIIRLSMHVREGKDIRTFNGNNNQVMVIRPHELNDGMLTWADQVLCAKNETRNMLNGKIRFLTGKQSEAPEAGDKIICLRNQWEIFTHNGNALTNGLIGTIDYISPIKNIYLPKRIAEKPLKVAEVSLMTDNDWFDYPLLIDYDSLLQGTTSTLTGHQQYLMSRGKNLPDPPLNFAYGYAITTWKAQGSEWGKVLGFEENNPFDKDEHRQYLYTLITRAQDKLVLVTKD